MERKDKSDAGFIRYGVQRVMNSGVRYYAPNWCVPLYTKLVHVIIYIYMI